MTLPAGALTATVTVGAPIDIAGTVGTLVSLTVRPDVPAGLVWAATGDMIEPWSAAPSLGDSPATSASLVILADQPGVLTPSTVNGAAAMVEIRSWPLVASWVTRQSATGAPTRHVRRFNAPTAGTTVDLDLLPADGVTVPATVTYAQSINIGTGAGSLDTEGVQDVVGAMIVGAGGTYDDGAGTITLPAGADSSAVTADDTPAAPAEGESASYLVTSAVVWPAGLVWSTDPDGGVAPTITGTALVSMFTVGGVTRAILGATFPALPDTVAPVAGTLASSSITETGFTLTVTGASDAGGLHAQPYCFDTGGGTFGAWQTPATLAVTGKAAGTAYTARHKVRDAAGNETTGASIVVTTVAADTTPPVWTATLTPGTPTETAVVVAATALATDNVAVTGYEVSYNGGSTWAAITPSGSNFTLAGTAGTTYATTKLRAKDAAGNTSTPVLSVPSYAMAASADVTAPTVGTMAASAITSSGFTLTVSGAADETALHATPYAFTTDGTTWSAYQSSAVYAATGLTASTGYSCNWRVRDAAGNVSTGTAQTVTTGAATAYYDAVMADAPWGYWRLGEASGTSAIDSSGNARHATYSGTYTLGAPSLIGTADTAVNFTSGKMQRAQPATKSPMTFEAIIKPNALSTAMPVGSTYSPEGRGWGLYTSATGTLLAQSYDGVWKTVESAAGSIVVGTTYHVATTYDNTTLRLYLNGVEVGTAVALSSLAPSGNYIQVGSRPQGDQFFNGVIDEAALYPAALSAARILAHAQAAGLA